MSEQHLIKEMRGYYAISIDSKTGIVFSEATGFWNMDIAEEYLGELKKAVEKSRSQIAKAHVLFDFSKSQVQSGAVFENNSHFMRAGDRAAVVVTSTLLKLQLARKDPHSDHGFFTDRPSALAWLSTSL